MIDLSILSKEWANMISIDQLQKQLEDSIQKIPVRVFSDKIDRIYIPIPDQIEYFDKNTISQYDAAFGTNKPRRIPRKIKKKLNHGK